MNVNTRTHIRAYHMHELMHRVETYIHTQNIQNIDAHSFMTLYYHIINNEIVIRYKYTLEGNNQA